MTHHARFATLAVVLLLAGAACSPRNSADEVPTPQPDGDLGRLVTTLEIETGEERVDLLLHVTNPTAEPVTLHFSSGQRYDFVVRRPDGTEVWRWSADRAFAQVLGTETLAPGASLRYSASWSAQGAMGSYEAVGVVTTRGRAIRESVDFALE